MVSYSQVQNTQAKSNKHTLHYTLSLILIHGYLRNNLHVCRRVHTSHTVNMFYHRMSPKCTFPEFLVNADPFQCEPLSAGAVEASAVHHGRVCPARRNEPLEHSRSCAVGGLQLPSRCAARLVFRRMTLQQRHRGDLPSSPSPSREAGTTRASPSY